MHSTAAAAAATLEPTAMQPLAFIHIHDRDLPVTLVAG